MNLQAFEDDLACIHQQMQEVVLRAAEHFGELSFQQHYADNYWTVRLLANGNTFYDGYAEESRGPTGRLNDLQSWELNALLNAAHTRFKQEAKAPALF